MEYLLIAYISSNMENIPNTSWETMGFRGVEI